MKKNVWYAVLHQKELDYLASYAYPGHIFLFYGGFRVLTDYLPLDGSKAMTGNLNMDDNDILFRTNKAKITSVAASNLWLRLNNGYLELFNYAGTQSKPIVAYNINTIQLNQGTGADFSFREYVAPAWQVTHVMRAADGTLDIPRAGDVTLLSAKILDAINAVMRLPNTRPGVPVANDCRYDPATDTFEIYDGAVWRAH